MLSVSKKIFNYCISSNVKYVNGFRFSVGPYKNSAALIKMRCRAGNLLAVSFTVERVRPFVRLGALAFLIIRLLELICSFR